MIVLAPWRPAGGSVRPQLPHFPSGCLTPTVIVKAQAAIHFRLGVFWTELRPDEAADVGSAWPGDDPDE